MTLPIRKNIKRVISLCALFQLALTPSYSQQTDSVSINEVVITGAREQVDLRHLPMSVSVVSNELIENRQQESLLSILSESVPSLFVTSRGIMGYGVSTGSSGGIKVRGIGGSPTTGVLILIDGHPQYMGIMGHPMADAYQSWISEKVEVVRSPASVLYGSNAMGGVINIITKKTQNEGVSAKADVAYGSYNTMTSEVTTSYHKNRFSTHISGSYNRSDGHRENMDFEQYGTYAKVGYEFSDRWRSTADVNITHFNASNPGEVDNPIYDNDSNITRGMTSFSLDNDYGNSSGALKLFYNWGKHIIDNGYYTGGEPSNYLFSSSDNMFGVNLYQSASMFKGNRVTLGFDYQGYGGVANNVFDSGTEVLLVDKRADVVSTYIDFRQSVGDFMTLNAGYRFDHNSIAGDNNIPQFGVSLYPTTSGVLKLLAAKGFRNPTIRDMYMFATQNPNLKTETLWNYEISWRDNILSDRLSYELNLFYINGENIIETVPINGIYTFVNTAKVENMGLELSTNYIISESWSASANYSFLDMKYEVLAAPKHKLYGSVNFSRKRLNISLGCQWIDGLYSYVSDSYNTEESFVLVNATARYKINNTITVNLKGENLLDQSYQINSGFPMPGASVMGGVTINIL